MAVLEKINQTRSDKKIYGEAIAEFKKIQEDKKKKGEKITDEEEHNWDIARRRLNSAEWTLEHELEELHKLLNHENEQIRKGANEYFQEHLEKRKKLAAELHQP